MTPAERRVAELVDRWLTSLELHLRYAALSDEAYWRVQPWVPHQRPARWILELAHARAQDLKHRLEERRAAGDAAFAESVELMGFLANLVGVQQVERFVPIAEPQRENAAAFDASSVTAAPDVVRSADAPVAAAPAPAAPTPQSSGVTPECAPPAPPLPLPPPEAVAPPPEAVAPSPAAAAPSPGPLTVAAIEMPVATTIDAVPAANDELVDASSAGDSTAAVDTSAVDERAVDPASGDEHVVGVSELAETDVRHDEASIDDAFDEAPAHVVAVDVAEADDVAVQGPAALAPASSDSIVDDTRVAAPVSIAVDADPAAVAVSVEPAIEAALHAEPHVEAALPDTRVPDPIAATSPGPAIEYAAATAPSVAPAPVAPPRERPIERVSPAELAAAVASVALPPEPPPRPRSTYIPAARQDAPVAPPSQRDSVPVLDSPVARTGIHRMPGTGDTARVPRPSLVAAPPSTDLAGAPSAAPPAAGLPAPTPVPETPTAPAADDAPTAATTMRARVLAALAAATPPPAPPEPKPAFMRPQPLTLAALEARLRTPATSRRAPPVGSPPAVASSTPERTAGEVNADTVAPRPATPASPAVHAEDARPPADATPPWRDDTIRTLSATRAMPHLVETARVRTLDAPTIPPPATPPAPSSPAAAAPAAVATEPETDVAAREDAAPSRAIAPRRPFREPPAADPRPAAKTRREPKGDGAKSSAVREPAPDASPEDLVIADAVRLLKWGKQWHELAEAIARMAGRPSVAEVRKLLRNHKGDIQRQTRG